MPKHHILVVDDEKGILNSLEGILSDEGFQVSKAAEGHEALEIILSDSPPDLVMLDIWIPGMDGLELLQTVKTLRSDIEIVMMSGHGNIETAVKATKLGAFDFIEKPLSLENVLLTVHHALGLPFPLGELPGGPEGPPMMQEEGRAEGVACGERPMTGPGSFRWASREEGRGGEEAGLTRGETPLCGAGGTPIEAGPRSNGVSQRTLSRSVVLCGQGLHSGIKSGMILIPLPPFSGIHFGDISTGHTIPAHLDYVDSTQYATVLKRGTTYVRTVEHLMAVLHIYGIHNLLIKISDEVPIMDGSAREFCQLIEDGGIEEQEAVGEELIIEEVYTAGDPETGRTLSIEPDPGLSVQFLLDLPHPVGHQEFTYTFQGTEDFRTRIAPARTFVFLKEVEYLEGKGLTKGGRLNNVILLDHEKVINTTLRFPDEFVRHKILDILGDLYLLGRPIRGRVTARMTGHTENLQLLQKIRHLAGRKAGSRGGR